MRYILIVCLIALPAVVDADQRSRGGGAHRGSRSVRAEALARPVIPSALLPAGSRKAAPRTAGRDWWQRPDDGRHHRPRRPHRPRYGDGGYYGAPFGGGGYFFGAPEQTDVDSDTPPPPPASLTHGIVRLDITPAAAFEYYVDGIYFGASSSLGTQFEMTAGARRFEVRAAGYAPLVFDLRINEGQLSTFRGSLEPLSQAAPRATGGRTMYVIPGCYIGNTKPQRSGLREGCDIRKLVTRNIL